MTNNSWPLRASACEFLAFSLRYPSQELAEALYTGEWADAATEIAEALELDFSVDSNTFAEVRNAASTEELLHSLRAEATRLFIGSPEPACSPFEGVWRAADDGVDALLFVNPHSMDVERFCRACGLGRPEGTNEPLDFVATEFELLQYLAMLAAGLAEPAEESPALSELPGGSAEGAYELFMNEHVLTWMPRFAEKVQAEARLPFYRIAAQFLLAFLR